MQQIARMFATLGFNVEEAGIKQFEQGIRKARNELNLMKGSATRATKQIRNLKRDINGLSQAVGKLKGAGAANKVATSYSNVARSANKLNNALENIARDQPKTTKALGKIHASIIAGRPHWDRYRESVVKARQSLHNINGEINRLRANSRVDVRIRNTGGGHGGGGSNTSGALGGMAAGLGMRGFLGNMFPAVALSGAGAGLGYLAKSTVEAAREQTRMESMLLMTSKNTEEFGNTLAYVKGEAARLGLSTAELGKSFAQINMSAKTLNDEQKKQMFTGFSEFMMSMGTGKDDQKGIFRAFNQMFSANRILQEEINQLSERGIPATLVYDAAMKAYGTDDLAYIKKLQEDSKLDPSKVLPVMADMLRKMAHDTGSYDKMMQSSIVKQGQFFNRLNAFAKTFMDSGVDEFLGDIFGQLTELVDVLEDYLVVIQKVIEQFGKLKSVIDSFTNGNGGGLIALATALLFGLMRWGKLSSGVVRATRAFRRNRSVMQSLGIFMKELFGRRVGFALLRLGLWGAAIWAVSEAVSFLANQLEKQKAGKWTWFDSVFSAIETAILRGRLEIARFLHDTKKLKDIMSGKRLFSDLGGLQTPLMRNSSIVGSSTARIPFRPLQGNLGGILSPNAVQNMLSAYNNNNSSRVPYSNQYGGMNASPSFEINVYNQRDDGSYKQKPSTFYTILNQGK